jgi:transposase-like protein
MPCPHCTTTTTTERTKRTSLGYRIFRCQACRRTCNERTGTPFNYLDTLRTSFCSSCSGVCVTS